MQAPSWEELCPNEEATTILPHLGSWGGSRAARRLAAGATIAALFLSSCTGTPPSTLKPHGPGATRIASLWWVMFGISSFVVVVVGVLVLFSVIPRPRRRHDPDSTPRWAVRMVVIGGLIFPAIVLTVLWILTLRDMNALSQPASPERLEIDVTGYQWWWKASYPAQHVVTANDIHIPTGQPVRIVLTTSDVNHSFWVPELTGKTDLIAGETTVTWLETDRPGVYRGQCAEYCGVQHANMIFNVVAQAPSDFQAWVGRQRIGAGAPATAALLHGEQVFLSQPCVTCHAVRGTSARGTAGPDLTLFGDRLTIGAGAVPNTPGYLGGWIVDAQGVKPGNKMPPIQLPAQDLQDVIAWLESMK